MRPSQGIEETALAGIRPSNQHHANPHDRLAAEGEFLDELIDLGGGLVKLPEEFFGRDERQILVGKVQSGLQVGEQFQEVAA